VIPLPGILGYQKIFLSENFHPKMFGPKMQNLEMKTPNFEDI